MSQSNENSANNATRMQPAWQAMGVRFCDQCQHPFAYEAPECPRCFTEVNLHHEVAADFNPQNIAV